MAWILFLFANQGFHAYKVKQGFHAAQATPTNPVLDFVTRYNRVVEFGRQEQINIRCYLSICFYFIIGI